MAQTQLRVVFSNQTPLPCLDSASDRQQANFLTASLHQILKFQSRLTAMNENDLDHTLPRYQKALNKLAQAQSAIFSTLSHTNQLSQVRQDFIIRQALSSLLLGRRAQADGDTQAPHHRPMLKPDRMALLQYRSRAALYLLLAVLQYCARYRQTNLSSADTFPPFTGLMMQWTKAYEQAKKELAPE